MGEGRVKTAFELAMEKVAEMPALNLEEIREEHKKESLSKGEAIARRYLQNIKRQTDIKSEIAAFEPEQRVFARNAALQWLSRELSLTQVEANRHILEGIASLNPDISVDLAMKRLNKVIDGFQKEIMAAYSLIEKSEINLLKKEGISGSAVKPNLRHHNTWLTKQAELTATHTGNLCQFQKTLLPD
ncbi:hypothetical protein KKI24_20890 [bacterium]|nr:hypothetical protein [bacterium]